MKKTLTLISALVLSGSIAFAGPMGYSSKGKVVETIQPEIIETGCVDCWTGGSFDAYAGYTFVDEEDGTMEDGFTAGIGVNHFMNEYIGIGFEAMWIEGESLVHQLGANILARLPIDMDSFCFAPYFLGGVGGHFDSVNQVTATAGLGLELLLPNSGCMGVFVDGRYVFADETTDYTTVRLGIRKSF